MSKDYDIKSNTVGDTPDPSTQQPPPPYSGGSNGNASTSTREANPQITEQSQLLTSGTVSTSYTTPYLPTPNLAYNPSNNNNSTQYYQCPLYALRTNPVMTTCPHCRHIVISNVRYENGGCTWLTCGIMCMFLAPFCFIPFCVTSLKDAVHYCPNCCKIMAKYSRFDGNVYQHRG